SGGTVNVSSGGAIDHTTVSSGGMLNVLSGATAHNVSVSSGGTFNVAGAVTSNVAVFAGGTEIVSSGGSTGPVTISGGKVELQAGSIASGGITFASSSGTLVIDGTAMPSDIISGIVVGDTIDLTGVAFASGGSATVVSGSMLQVVEGGITYDLQLGQNPGVGFTATQDSGTGTLITATPPITPSVNVANYPSASAGQLIALSSLVTVSDPNGAGYQTLQLWDSNGTAAGGEFLINGVAQTAGHAINVPSGANVVFDAGTSAGTDTMWAQLVQNNGTLGSWQQFTVSVPAPTLSVSGVPSTTAGAQIALSSLVNVSDPSNATYQLQLWDSNGTVAGGEFLINGVAQLAGQAINVPSGANVVFDAGTSSGTDTLWAQLIQNGTASGWKQFTVSVPSPTLNVSSLPSATAGAQIALSSLVNVSNPSNATYQ
ncbi:hypothetical protein FNJ47_46555, partial [Bradyrhizobium sp. UFLA 03-164]|nr:hypothetical protein [Bradyrhizobium uaiense]